MTTITSMLMAAGAISLAAGANVGAQDIDLDLVLEGKSSQGVVGTSGYQKGYRDRDDRDWDDRDRRYGREFRFDCRSYGAYERCPVGGRIGSLRFSSSRSSSGCQIGRDWGVERNAVWVDNGCRASFQIGLQSGYDDRRRGDDRYGEARYIYCASKDTRYELCRIRGDFRDVRLEDRRSDARCRKGSDWGITREGIWVNNGCRATFSYELVGYDRRY